MSEKISPITQKALDHAQLLEQSAHEMLRVVQKVNLSEDVDSVFEGKEKNIIMDALAYHAADTIMSANSIRNAIENGSESGNLESHDEKAILEGCIAMMQSVGGRVNEWIEWLGIWPDDENEYLDFGWYYSEIVRRLFLWNTTHSGGTSTYAKCRELGVDPCDTVTVRISNNSEEGET